MSIIKILNVGQGDCIMIEPTANCKYRNSTIFVDLGPGNCDISNYVKDEPIHIFITHHDSDHLKGIQFLLSKKYKQIKEITVPFYQNEITLIAKAILSLKGINSSKDCNEFIAALNDLVNNQVLIKSLVENGTGKPMLSFANDSTHFCNHIKCLNPPTIIESYDWIQEISENDLYKKSSQIFEPNFAREIQIYVSNCKSGYYYGNFDSRTIDAIFLHEHNQNNSSNDIGNSKANFVINHLMENFQLFEAFNKTPNRKNFSKIYSTFVKKTHDVCTVLMADYYDHNILLAGDASKKVFMRLIKENKNIKSEYLKVPHHGSKHNLNEVILSAINPSTSIISHNNGHFGKSSDTHPNTEILKLLQSKKIKILITNDVNKNNITIMKKINHSTDPNNFVTIET